MHNRERLIKAIDNSACLTRRQMDDYLQNKLFPEELYVVEMHLNECPFCDESLDGFAKTANANAFLSATTDFVIPSVATQVIPQKPTKKIVEEGIVSTPLRVEEEIKSTTKATDNPFNKESRKSTFPFTLAIAASVAVVLAAWGIFKWNRIDTIESNKMGNIATKLDEDGAAIQNKESIDRKKDSIMNEKYAFQNQDPLNGKSSVWVNQTRHRTGSSTDSGQNVASTRAAADVAVNTSDASGSARNNTESSNGFVGPRMPKDEEPKAAPVAKPTTTKAKVEASTVASKRDKVADEKDKNALAKKEKDEKAKEKKAKEEKAKADKASGSITQAEKNFNRGKELYNQKKFAASISYFQSAAKVKDYAKAKQAESFIKLAKSEVLKAEREKNSKK